MDRSSIKQKAKTVLGNNIFGETWLMTLVIFLIFSAIVSAASYILPGIGSILIVGPLSFGVSLTLLKLIREGGKIDFGNLFKGFTEDFGGTLLLSLLSSIFIFLWSLLFIIPGIVKAYAYSMAFYIKADHPEYDWKQCLKESIRITDGHKMDLFVLDLSYIGWYIVGSLCFGIGTLWVTPYHETAKALYYEEIKNA